MYFCLSGMKPHLGSPSWKSRESCFMMSTIVTETPAPSHRLHVVAELLHGGERRHVLHAAFLAGVGDDDELLAPSNFSFSLA